MSVAEEFVKRFAPGLVVAAAVIAIACAANDSAPSSPGEVPPSPPPPGGSSADVSVTVDTLQRFQTMTGWEAVAQAGQEGEASFPLYKTVLFDRAVNDLGINRLRLEAKSGMENTSDYYVRRLLGQDTSFRCERWLTVNDNNDPNVINPGGFHFSQIDSSVTEVVEPMRKLLAARGEKLFVNFTYTAFVGQCGPNTPYVHSDPAEYAEFILAAFLHIKNTYGWVPDSFEVILEPDHAGVWQSGTFIGRALVAAAARLAAAGFHPLIVAPSTSRLDFGIVDLAQMYAVPGVDKALGQLSYHRYAITTSDQLKALAQLAATHGASTAMLEHIASNVEDLYADLTLAQVSSWEQFTLAFPEPGDNGGKYFLIVNNKPEMSATARYLRQYFHYVRLGAHRIAANSSGSAVRPVGFQNADGGMVVVMHVDRTGTIEIRGLRPGRYGASITSSAATGTELAENVVAKGATLRMTSPSVGVLTVYQK